MSYVVAFLFLSLLGLLLYLALEWYGERRSRQWLSRAVAIQIGADEVEIPITVVEPAPADSEAAASEVAQRRPWFGRRPRLLDGGEVIDQTWGPN